MQMQPMAIASEGDLIERAKAGDRDAFDQLVGPLVEKGFRLAAGMLHDKEAAEDVVQESAIKAWRKLAQLKPDTEMRPWFLAIVANECRSLARGRWWSVLRLDPSTEFPTSNFEDRVVRGADLRAALRRLPAEQREVLVLRFYLDLPVDEVASVAGVPEGTVKSRINRALASMRPYFQTAEAWV